MNDNWIPLLAAFALIALSVYIVLERQKLDTNTTELKMLADSLIQERGTSWMAANSIAPDSIYFVSFGGDTVWYAKKTKFFDDIKSIATPDVLIDSIFDVQRDDLGNRYDLVFPSPTEYKFAQKDSIYLSPGYGVLYRGNGVIDDFLINERTGVVAYVQNNGLVIMRNRDSEAGFIHFAIFYKTK